MKTELKDVLHLYIGCEAVVTKSSYTGVHEKEIHIGETVHLNASKLHQISNYIFLAKPKLRHLADITEGERKELFKLVFNRLFPDNGGTVFTDKKTTLQEPRWVMSSGVDRLGILLNGEVWYDCDLQAYKFNQHLITLFYCKRGFDLFGLLESEQAVLQTQLK